MKDIVFDFGQVLVKFKPEIMLLPYADDPDDIKLLSEVIFDRLYWDRLDAGTIEDDEVKSEVHKRIPKRLWEAADLAYDNWMFHLPEIDGMRDLLLSLKEKGHRIFVLSDISKGFAARADEIPILSLADGCVFSAVCGYCKPDKNVFLHLCKKYSIEPRNAIFVDDKEKNCKGAESIGMESIVFDGDVKKLRKKLIK